MTPRTYGGLTLEGVESIYVANAGFVTQAAFSALIARVREADADGWSTIDSAPKDGTHILGYGRYYWGATGSPEDQHRLAEFGALGVVVMCWEDNDLWEEGDPDHELGCWKTVTANPYQDGVAPTHWRALPAPPKAGK